MATLAGDSRPDPTPTPGLHSLAFVDISTLTQSELLALSLGSPTASTHIRRTHDLPAIDPSTFNESAGSRRQTFSRPIPSSSSSSVHHRPRVAIAGRLPAAKTALLSDLIDLDASEDPHSRGNSSIIAFLKQSLRTLPDFYDIDFNYTPPIAWQDISPSIGGGERKRKRKRGRKPKSGMEQFELKLNPSMARRSEVENGPQIVNKKGDVIDIVALAGLEDPYGNELRRRTEGMKTEEQLFGFLSDLGGQWCSRRRRRKIVDACIFGNILPVGWKLLLGLKRKDGRAWVYCRRYVSPGGEHFLSCKEVSAYLQSFYKPFAVSQQGVKIQHDESNEVSESLAGTSHCNDAERQSNERSQLSLLGTDNLAEVQVRNLFECRKCNAAFDERDEYLQHLLSVHQRKSQGYKVGSPVGEDVIPQDGNFECQFCHKMFHEKCQHDSHIETHLRNNVRVVRENPEDLTLQKSYESPANNGSPTRISRMDALIEIAQSSMLENFGNASPKPSCKLTPDGLIEVSKQEPPASSSEMEMDPIYSPTGEESQDDVAPKNLYQGLLGKTSEYMTTHETLENIEEVMHVVDIRVETTLDDSTAIQDGRSHKFAGVFTPVEIEKFGTERKIDLENSLTASLKTEAAKLVDNENLMDTSVNESWMSAEEKDNWPTEPGQEILSEAVHQDSEGGLKNCSIDSKQDKNKSQNAERRNDDSTRCEELRLNEMGLLTFDIGAAQDSQSAPVLPTDLSINEGAEGLTFGSSDHFEAGEVMLSLAGRSRLTLMCVWCRNEFSQEGIYSEMPSDSVGYMCPACKVKISGQIGELDDGSSITSPLF